jgi:hypothetical protein
VAPEVDYVRAVPRTTFIDVLRTATTNALRDSVRRQMPAGPLRDYFRDALEPTWPGHPSFTQAIGLNQLVRLHASLVGGLVDDAIAPKVADLLARLAVYQTYEIMSDNLGHGLFGQRRNSAAAVGRRRLVRSFNAAITVRLGGGGRSAAAALGPERRRASRVSAFEQSLAEGTHRRLMAQLTGAPAARIERDVWPALVANIEAAVDVAATVAGTPVGGAVRDGLIERYRAVDRTMSARHLSRLELAAIGTHSVLVIPTLAYGLGVIADLAHPVPGLAKAVADGSLPAALHEAALVTRLLNDIGPGLLRLGRDARRATMRRVRAESAGRDLADSLTGPRFTRLAKDLTHGEFNVCLYAARRATGTADAFEALEADLDYFAGLYALHRGSLSASLGRITARLGDPRPATLIGRFVRFHARLYTHPYQQRVGEYAI